MGKELPSIHTEKDLELRKNPNSFTEIAERFLDPKNAHNEVTKQANAIIGCCLLQLNTPKPNLMDFDSCKEALENYFRVLGSRNVRPTVSGIANCLGLTRSAFLNACDTGCLINMITGAPTELPSEVWQLFAALKENYVAMLESFMETGLVHPASGIFLLKNNADYKDVVERKYTVTQTTFDENALAEKYAQEINSFDENS